MEELHDSFKPMLTPKQMLHKGIFGGTYFNQLVDYRIFPKDWFKGLDESYYLSKKYLVKINYLKLNQDKLKKSGRKKDGFIKMIQEAGLNGIVSTTSEDVMKMTLDR